MKPGYTFDYFQESAELVRSRIGFQPEIGLILGSGLGPLDKEIKDPVSIPYKDIPNFLVSSAPHHAGKLICGTLGGKKVACMSGRFHTYEGYDPEELTAPVRLFKLLGVKAVIATNAAGAVNESYKPGDAMILKDHIKLTGDSPLRGSNVAEFGPRFFDVSKMYTPELRKIARELAADSGMTVHEGNYFFMTGPQFETPAEIRAIRILGGDVVGMSTVTEALTAAHCGMPFLAISLVSNMAAGILEQPLTSQEVIETTNAAGKLFSQYVRSIIAAL